MKWNKKETTSKNIKFNEKFCFERMQQKVFQLFIEKKKTQKSEEEEKEEGNKRK